MRNRFPLLNWRPDAEPVGNTGLVTADNVIHEPEGFKPAHLKSAGSFSTSGGLASVTSLVAKPVGSGDDFFCAWISADTIHVGLNGVTMTSATTGYPLSFTTAGSSQEITFFDVAEAYGLVFFVAEASQIEAVPATTSRIAISGYSTITSV